MADPIDTSELMLVPPRMCLPSTLAKQSIPYTSYQESSLFCAAAFRVTVHKSLHYAALQNATLYFSLLPAEIRSKVDIIIFMASCRTPQWGGLLYERDLEPTTGLAALNRVNWIGDEDHESSGTTA